MAGLALILSLSARPPASVADQPKPTYLCTYKRSHLVKLVPGEGARFFVV